ncbi:MAG: hypothetical protein EP338_06460 [Bacteroidetes bacterium]|nr:MAG: hypothetical protein EP338_06460 [Bacteroidota bacterium]
MIYRVTSLVALCLIVLSCSEEKKVDDQVVEEKPSKEVLKDMIQEMDDSLKVLYGKIRNNEIQEISNLNFNEAINRNLAYYRHYPEDQFSARALDKVIQLCTQVKAYDRALAYSDTLISKYDGYEGKKEVLLNAGSLADGVLGRQDKCESYYRQLLKEYPNLDQETKELVEFRLEHIDLTFDQMIELRMKEAAQK